MARTLILLPGLLCDAAVWSAQAAALGATWDVRTPGFLDHDSVEGMARAILADAPERFAVAGHSMGGRVALEILGQAPERVERVALLDTGARPPQPTEAASRGGAVPQISRPACRPRITRAWPTPPAARCTRTRWPCLT